MQGAPKFGKVELILKEGDNRERISYDDCGMVITGNYIIIVEDEKSDVETTTTSTATIYNISEIAQYKTHAK